MADKQVKVTLRADVTNYRKGMREAGIATRELGNGSDDLAKRNAELEQSAQHVGTGMLVMGGAIAAGIGFAVNAYAEFDQAMSAVQAATHASAADMDLLTEAAREAGSSTAFSATEAAQAIEELSKAGVSTTDILTGGLTGALDLAAAGNLGVAEAAEIAASTMTQFGLAGEDVSHIADVLAAGAGKAQGSVQDMANALAYAGIPASKLGVSVEETSGAIALLASNGIIGEQAGTSLRSMLLSLSAPTKIAAATMEEYGIEVYDAAGNFIGLEGAAGVLQERLGHLSQEQQQAALSTMFGNQSISAGIAIMDAGADGVREWTDAVNDSGYAAETASLMQDNLRGDLEKLGGAWDDLLIGMGEGANGPMRFAVQGLTDLVDVFGGLDPLVQGGVIGFGALMSGALLLGGAFLTIVPQIAQTRQALEVLGISTDNLKGKLGLLSVVASGVAIAFTTAAANSQAADASFDALVDTINQGVPVMEQLDAAAKSVADTQIADSPFGMSKLFGMDAGAYSSGLKLIKDNLDEVFSMDGNRASAAEAQQVLKEMGDALGEVADTDMTAAAVGFADFANEVGLAEENYGDMVNAMPGFFAKLSEQADALGIIEGAADTAEEKTALVAYALELAGDAASGSSGEMGELSGELSGLTGEMTEQEQAVLDAAEAYANLSDEIRAYDDLMSGLVNAEVGFYQAIDDVNQALIDNGATLDVTTQAGRDNKSALDALAGSTTEYVASLLDSGAGHEEMAAAMQLGRDEFVEMATAMTGSATEAEALADAYGLIPENVKAPQIDMPDVSTLAGELTDIAGQLSNLGEGETHIFVDALTDDARAKLEEAGIAVTTLSDGRWRINVDADPEKALAELDALTEIIGDAEAEIGLGADSSSAEEVLNGFLTEADGSTGTPTVDADAAPAEGQVLAWKLNTDGTWAVSHMDAEKAEADSTVITWKQNADGTWATSHMGADASSAYDSKATFVQNANGTWSEVNVDADTSSASNSINNLNGRTITVYTVAVARPGGIMGTYTGGMYSYNGMRSSPGVFEAFANGGMAIASGLPTGIYPGGSNIHKFAEPETGWEAYISGKPGLEHRNIGIGFDALRRLGATYEDALLHLGGSRVQHYADGGLNTYRPAQMESRLMFMPAPAPAQGASLTVQGPLVEVGELRVDSDSRVQEVAEALWTRAERESRAQGKVNLGGVVK